MSKTYAPRPFLGHGTYFMTAVLKSDKRSDGVRRRRRRLGGGGEYAKSGRVGALMGVRLVFRPVRWVTADAPTP